MTFPERHALRDQLKIHVRHRGWIVVRAVRWGDYTLVIPGQEARHPDEFRCFIQVQRGWLVSPTQLLEYDTLQDAFGLPCGEDCGPERTF